MSYMTKHFTTHVYSGGGWDMNYEMMEVTKIVERKGDNSLDGGVHSLRPSFDGIISSNSMPDSMP